MAASSEDFLAQALLSLKDSSTNTPNNFFMGSTLKDVDQRMKQNTMYQQNPPVLLEPSVTHSNNDFDSLQKLQLKSLMSTKDKTFYCKKTPSTNIHSLLSTTTSCSVANQANNVPSSFDNSFTMTFSNQKALKSNSASTTSWDLSCTYSGVGISKPRKMMINRWYAESLTSPKSIDNALQEQFTPVKEKKEEEDSPLTPSDSGDDAEEEYTQPSDSHEDDSTIETVSSCSSSEEVKTSKKQSPQKQTKKKSTTPVVRKKKKHTTKGQFNTGWWSDDEHQRFLKGLKECGHNWKMISTKYVKTRGRRQCASHAQKWYLSIRYNEEREQMEKM